MSDAYPSAHILIVDDQEANVAVLEAMLETAGYTQLSSLADGREVAAFYTTHAPDLILLDLHMPHLDGFAVLARLGLLIPPDSYLPILVLTADITPEAKQRALGLGARDFLTKPFDRTEVCLRIKNLLETRLLHLGLQDQNRLLEARVRERTQALLQAQQEIIERLALAAEYRDDETGRHAQRVGETAALLARALGVPTAQVELIRRAAPLHDVGKIGIADQILLKAGPLTGEELERMRRHAAIGAGILSGSTFALLQVAEEIALSHHERWDGSGYPGGLAGAAIPLAGRIVALADVYDALTHARPYKQAWSVDEALAEIERQRGLQFDPRVVDAFWSIMAPRRAAAPTAARTVA
jgi:putative two-component system response regulator